MKALLIAGGELNEPSAGSLNGHDMLICVDGGLRHADALGLAPDYILGDFDSASPELVDRYRGRAELVAFSREKDFTDTELAFQFAIDKGATDILLLGGLGGRFDHALANVHALVRALNAGARAAILDGRHRITLTDGRAELSGQKGGLVSLIPLTTRATGVTTSGLKYPLYGETLAMGSARGVSNEFLGERAEVTVASGVLIIIEARED